MSMLSRDSKIKKRMLRKRMENGERRLDFHAFGRLDFCGAGTRTAGKIQFFDSLMVIPHN